MEKSCISKKKLLPVLLICTILFVIILFTSINVQKKRIHENFASMYPNTDEYLQDTYGSYYTYSDITINGRVTVLFYIDDEFVANMGFDESKLEDCLFFETRTIYGYFLNDYNGEKRWLDGITIEYDFKGINYKYHI